MLFKLVKNCKRGPDFPEGNCFLAWDRVATKFVPHTASSYLDLNNRFENSVLASVNKDTDEWITELESLRAKVDDTNFSAQMT